MTWLVFGVSCLLVLAGAVSVISGAPIIQIERGWAEVIAGTVALSSGGIVFALAAILMRLEAVREAIATRSATTWLPPVAEEQTDPVVLPSAAPPEPPVSASAETVTELVSSEAESDTVDENVSERHGLWKRVRRPEPETAPVPVPVPPVEPNPPEIKPFDRTTDRDLPPRIDMLPPAEAEPMPAPSVASVASAADEAPVAAEDRTDEQSLGWLDRSLFRARSKPAEARDTAPLATDGSLQSSGFPASSRIEPSLTLDAPAVFTDPIAETHTAPPVSHESVDTHGPEAPSDEVTVIGRYQAGVASYIMYSDGTIQVETEGGELHRFSSMDELKAYIASQDNPAS